MPVNSAKLEAVIENGARGAAHAASTAQAQSRAPEGGPGPFSVWTEAGSSFRSWSKNLNFAAATKTGVIDAKYSRTALADIPGSVEARAEGIVDAAKGVADAAKGVADAAKNFVKAEGALAMGKGALAMGKGALATVGATFQTLTAVEQLLSVPYSAIPFPALPAARIWDWAFGIPHAHSHWPNWIPPAPPVPFPANGPVIPIPYVSGAAKVLINGVPAARCGDIGINIWCGGFFPMYEIYCGSSNVWIEGCRAARLGVDMTKHCVFSKLGPKDLPLGPPIGALVTASPNVIIGGFPMPSFSAYAIGKAFGFIGKGFGFIGKKLKAARAAAARRAGVYGVDASMRAADIAAGVIENGRYIVNPTARNLADMLTKSGRIGGKKFGGQYMYVIGRDGRIVIGSRAGQRRMPHPTLIGGKNPQVLGAGIVDIRGGRIYSVNNASGHFKPGPESLSAAKDAFSNLPPTAFHRDFQGYSPHN